MSNPIRVLVAKPGLDGHDRGAKIVARAFRDAGMEVVYTGLHIMPEQIAEIAVQEDVNVIGLSILSGAHRVLVPKVVNFMKAKGIEDVVYVVGGIIPPSDVALLKEAGVHEVFGPGTNLDKMMEKVKERVNEVCTTEV
jgi:methylmalonyl-CoA mutase C-terminal domain/subunit